MVSSKFSRSAHAFRVPAVCKDKLKKVPVAPDIPPGPPLPQDPIQNDYVFHGTSGGNSYDYEGNIVMPQFTAADWHSPWPPGPDNVYCKLFWNPATYGWFSNFWITPAAAPWINFNSPADTYVPNGPFDTGVFTYNRVGWVGVATGRITNVL